MNRDTISALGKIRWPALSPLVMGLPPAVIREMARKEEYLTRLIMLTGHTADQLVRLVQSLPLSYEGLYNRAVASETALDEIRVRIEQLDAANRPAPAP